MKLQKTLISRSNNSSRKVSQKRPFKWTFSNARFLMGYVLSDLSQFLTLCYLIGKHLRYPGYTSLHY